MYPIMKSCGNFNKHTRNMTTGRITCTCSWNSTYLNTSYMYSMWLYPFDLFFCCFVLQNLPPIRNQTKRKKKKKQEPSPDTKKGNKPQEGERISSYDYRSWDKFDVVSVWILVSPSLVLGMLTKYISWLALYYPCTNVNFMLVLLVYYQW